MWTRAAGCLPVGYQFVGFCRATRVDPDHFALEGGHAGDLHSPGDAGRHPSSVNRDRRIQEREVAIVVQVSVGNEYGVHGRTPIMTAQVPAEALVLETLPEARQSQILAVQALQGREQA
jgi:hypothetical protein